MQYYFILLILIILIYKIENSLNIFNYLSFIILALFAGLRNKSVGTDTYNYIDRYKDSYAKDVEFGYQLLEKIGLFISSEYFIILLLSSSIFCFFVIKTINKISQIKIVSFFLFLTSGYYFFIFNGIRQGLASSITFYAFYFILNRKLYKFLFWVLIASFFHKSALVVLPIYFLFKIPFSFKNYFLIILGSVFLILSYNSVIGSFLFFENYTKYNQIVSSGLGIYFAIFHSIQLILFLIFRKILKASKKIKQYDFFLYLYTLGSIIFIVVVSTSLYIEITRLAIFFITSSLFIWPLILSQQFKNKRLLYTLVIIFYLIYYYYFYSTQGDLFPYNFNTDIF